MSKYGLWDSYTHMSEDEYLERHIEDALSVFPPGELFEEEHRIHFSKIIRQAYNKGRHDGRLIQRKEQSNEQ